LDDLAVIRRYFDMEDSREALDHAPPGIGWILGVP